MQEAGGGWGGQKPRRATSRVWGDAEVMNNGTSFGTRWGLGLCAAQRGGSVRDASVFIISLLDVLLAFPSLPPPLAPFRSVSFFFSSLFPFFSFLPRPPPLLLLLLLLF